jgi:hypothetical protein
VTVFQIAWAFFACCFVAYAVSLHGTSTDAAAAFIVLTLFYTKERA